MNLESVLFSEVLSEWKRNVSQVFIRNKKGELVQDWRHPVWSPLCTYVRKYVRGKLRTNYDLHYVNPVLSSGGSADVCFYVLKYMMKPSNRAINLQRALHLNLPEDEYSDLWSVVRPRHFESEALGLGQCVYSKDSFGRRHYEVSSKVLKHLREGIEFSKRMPGEPIASYFSPEDGKSHPLAKYYKSHPDIFTMSDFLDFFYGSKQSSDNVIVRKDKHFSQLCKAVDDFEFKVNNVSFQQTSSELDELFQPLSDDLIIDLQDG